MADPFTGEIRMMANSYAPFSWMFCAGQFLNIYQNQALYALLETQFGGDGYRNFRLPDLCGRIPIGSQGDDEFWQGRALGQDTETLTTNQTPSHTHTAYTYLPSKIDFITNQQEGSYLSRINNVEKFARPYSTDFVPDVYMNAQSLSPAGGIKPTDHAAPHENRQPYLVINYYICCYGNWPNFS